ncbi:uncharacterized protein LOC134166666 [Pezoporus occidentalis]|uniref:uncharacterized protein LOC134166666 n=1 Tax=Pezoporus occidentalis TaxID=407982 RepID=UPI002F91941A
MGQWLCCCRSRDDPGPNQQCVPDRALPKPLLREPVQVTQGHGQRKKRDLVLFRDTLVIAKTKPGSIPCPQHCLVLVLLQVLSGGKGSDGDAAEEEEEGKATSSLVFLWPCGSCVITFCSRAVKELRVNALLGPPEGVQGARVTQLPSIRLMLKELSGRHAVSVHPASALPPGAAPAQHQLHRSSPSVLFHLPRGRHWMPAAWRSCSSARLRSDSLEVLSHPSPPLTHGQQLMQLSRGPFCCEVPW